MAPDEIPPPSEPVVPPEPLVVLDLEPAPPKRRGRPPGVKSKPKPESLLPVPLDPVDGLPLVRVRGLWLTQEQAAMVKRHIREFKKEHGAGARADVVEWWFAEVVGSRGLTPADVGRLKILGEGLGILGQGAVSPKQAEKSVKRRLIRFKMVGG